MNIEISTHWNIVNNISNPPKNELVIFFANYNHSWRSCLIIICFINLLFIHWYVCVIYVINKHNAVFFRAKQFHVMTCVIAVESLSFA